MISGSPNYVLKFEDGLMQPRNESLQKDIINGILLIMVLIILLLAVFAEVPAYLWFVGVVLILAGRQYNGYERRPVQCELRFYDDYIIQYYERKYYSKSNIRREYYKFYYKDITKCLYRTVCNKIDIFGVVEAEFYRYMKDDVVCDTPSFHKTAKSCSVFYTVFARDIDFVKEIEEHSPLKVEFGSF